jgi:hypothetical protein
MKRLVTTRIVSNKRGASKGKEKESKAATTTGDGWKASKCFEADLQALVDEGLLQNKTIIQWRAATWDTRPYKGADELVLFQCFVERGLALPTFDISIVFFSTTESSSII